MPKSLPWETLNQLRPDYNEDLIRRLRLLYKGGYDIIRHSSKFMPKWNMETPAAYADRLAHAAYQNNFAEIVNDISANLFQKALQILPAADAEIKETPGEEPETPAYYLEFAENADQQKHSIHDILKCLNDRAMTTQQSFLGIDFEDSLPYVYEVDNLSVLDYEVDDFGNFLWVVLRNDTCKRDGVSAVRHLITSTFMYWKVENEIVSWERYQITYPPEQPPQPSTPVPLIAESGSQAVSFKEIPLLCYELPDELFMGGLIGQLCQSLFVRTSSFYHALSRGMYGILVYKQGESDADDDVSSSVEDDDQRGLSNTKNAKAKGAMVAGPNDEVSFVEMKGEAFKVVQEQLKQDKNELYRIVNQMGSIIGGSTSALGSKSSGLSKQIDNRNKEIILSAYANLIRKAAIKIFSIISCAKGEDIVWQAKGMDNYHEVDNDALMAKVTNLPIIRANILSPTSYKQILQDITAELHPYTNPGTLSIIAKEIDEAVDQMDMMEEATSNNPNHPASQQDKASSSPSSSSSSAAGGSAASSDADVPLVGESGAASGYEGMHLQTGEHIDPQIIYDQLSKDYDEKYIKFVLSLPWRGPLEVPITSLDFSNQANWEAAKRTDKIAEFKEMMNSSDEGLKPIVVVNEMNTNGKFIVLDGHTRSLAAKEAGKPILAYIGEVGRVSKEMKAMHSMQDDGEAGGNRANQKERSNQK
jgi:ParB-like nuclease domain